MTERPIHTYPENDLRDHDTSHGTLCPCLPRTKEGGMLIVHNAYDGRECGEVFTDLLRLLQAALGEHRHEWTDQERDAVQHAQHLVSMHWPRAGRTG